MSNPRERSILSKWLEQRLKEYFARKLRQRHLREQGEFDWRNASDEKKRHQINGVVPVEAAFLDFRILDLKLEKEEMSQSYDPLFEENELSEKAKSSWADDDDDDGEADDDDEPYKQGNSRVHLIYQKGSHSVGKELHLLMQAAQFENGNREEDEEVTSSKQYFLSLDEHQIDVYTRLFPLLQDWALSRNVVVKFRVPECFFGSYQTETRKDPCAIPDQYVFLDGDDIMSKVAAGMDFFEMEKQGSESGQRRMRQSSYRLLILEDVEQVGFKTRIAPSSTFLSLLSVEEALKSLAEIHAVSWTFSVITGDPLETVCPFLKNPLYIHFVGGRVLRGFPVMVGMVRDYLLRREIEENEVKGILQTLIELKTRLAQILEGSHHPRTIRCLVHQDTSSTRFLFRYSLLEEGKAKRRLRGTTTTTTTKGNSSNNNNYNGNCGGGSGLDESGTSVPPPPSPLLPESLKSESSSESKARRDCLEKGLRREVMIINWQTAAVGSPMLDVAFLLMTALPPKTRRAETMSLLKIYWNTFRMHAEKFGVTLEWSDKELYEDYVDSLLYTCVLITGNVDSESLCMPDDDGIEVFLEAIKDLMSAGVI